MFTISSVVDFNVNNNSLKVNFLSPSLYVIPAKVKTENCQILKISSNAEFLFDSES